MDDDTQPILYFFKLFYIVFEHHLDKDDNTIHDDMDHYRHEQPSADDIEETERVCHSDVDQDMCKIPVGHCENQTAQESGHKKADDF